MFRCLYRLFCAPYHLLPTIGILHCIVFWDSSDITATQCNVIHKKKQNHQTARNLFPTGSVSQPGGYTTAERRQTVPGRISPGTRQKDRLGCGVHRRPVGIPPASAGLARPRRFRRHGSLDSCLVRAVVFTEPPQRPRSPHGEARRGNGCSVGFLGEVNTPANTDI